MHHGRWSPHWRRNAIISLFCYIIVMAAPLAIGVQEGFGSGLIFVMKSIAAAFIILTQLTALYQIIRLAFID